ncbi:type II toxin-antitoxin system HicA family toxin [Actinomyces sp. Z5]|nr:type II toxin-antitoxin system HicA family toxin [Actinomyces sp. Z5]RAX22631.1 type II toxin-antitoxin system HicA family toxin [Actinomyces sp. Z3]
MRYRDLARMLVKAGFTARRGKGDHEVWRCGSVTVVITRTPEVSPKVTRDALRAIERSRT